MIRGLIILWPDDVICKNDQSRDLENWKLSIWWSVFINVPRASKEGEI